MKKNGILVIGLNPVMQRTLILDHLHEGEVNRTSSHRMDISGKGMNVARVLTELKAPVTHISHAGGVYREIFLDMARAEGIKPLLADSMIEIRQCHTLINLEYNIATEIVEESGSVAHDTENCVRKLFLQSIEHADIMTISGTKAAGYSDTLIPWMVSEATNRGKVVILDVRGRDLIDALPYKPTIIKVNMREFMETFGSERMEAVEDHMTRLEEDEGITTILTRGKDPVVVRHDGTIKLFPVEPIVPVNPIGSGDAFTAGLAYGMHLRLPFEKTITFGIACGRENALNLRPGTITGNNEGFKNILKLLKP